MASFKRQEENKRRVAHRIILTTKDSKTERQMKKQGKVKVKRTRVLSSIKRENAIATNSLKKMNFKIERIKQT